MAEVVAALALGSSIISFIDIGEKVVTRVREFIDTSKEVPEILRDISDRLETLLLTAKNLKSALNAGKLNDGAKAALKSTVGGLERQTLALQSLCEHMIPTMGDLWWQKARKAVSSVRKDKELKNALGRIIAYESTLNLYFTTAAHLTDSPSVPWDQRIYHDVAPFPLGKFIGRRRILDRVAASFMTDQSTHRMTVVLLGIGGQGKTLIAREYCRRLRDHSSIFWVDASSYSTALEGMKHASQLLDSSSTSDLNSGMQKPPAAKLESLLHPVLIVLDNMDHGKDFTKIMQLMPESNLCAVLITSRHRDAAQLGTCIEINSMEQDEAVELLLTKCNLANESQCQDHAESIVQALAYLALAIDQAGAYISSRNLPLAQFLDHFNTRKQIILKYVPSGWPYQRAQEDQQSLSDLCVFTTWELSLNELGSSVDVEPYIHFLTFAAFTGSSILLPVMLKAQVEESLATELDCQDLYTTDGKWDPWKYQDAIVQLYSVSLVSEIDLDSAGITFTIHPLVEEWLRIRPRDPNDALYIEANTKLIHRTCDRHIERVSNFYAKERGTLYSLIANCAIQNGFLRDLNIAAHEPSIPYMDTERATNFSKVFVLALPSFVRYLVDCGEITAAKAMMQTLQFCMQLALDSHLPRMTADALPQFACACLCANASIILHDSESLESQRTSEDMPTPQTLRFLLEQGILSALKAEERCLQTVKLLYGQVYLALGEVEAARTVLIEAYAKAQQSFGTSDVLIMEFQTALAEVYIARRELEMAIPYLNSAMEPKNPAISDICAIMARALGMKIMNITGSFKQAETTLIWCLDQAAPIVGGDHLMLWQIWFDLIEAKMGLEDYDTAEDFLKELRESVIRRQGPDHLDETQSSFQLACLKFRIGVFDEAEKLFKIVLEQQRRRHGDDDDRVIFTKAVLWLNSLQGGKVESEDRLRNDLLGSLGRGLMPDPQLARDWPKVALMALHLGAVDVALQKEVDIPNPDMLS